MSSMKMPVANNLDVVDVGEGMRTLTSEEDTADDSGGASRRGRRRNIQEHGGIYGSHGIDLRGKN